VKQVAQSEPAVEDCHLGTVGGGANVVQQYLSAGLLDEMLISVVPVLLGSGARLFDNLGEPLPRLRQVEAVEAPGVTHIRYARLEQQDVVENKEAHDA
jgi:dihydrofolate reductase